MKLPLKRVDVSLRPVRFLFAFAGCGALAFASTANEPVESRVSLVAMTPAKQNTDEAGSIEQVPQALHVFGGRTVGINFRLKGEPGVAGEMEAQCFAVADGLRAPLGAWQALGSFRLNEKGEGELFAEVPVSKPARRIGIDAQLRARVESAVVPVGSGHFMVYPDDLVAPLKRAGMTLGVFGGNEALRSFFKEKEVPFKEMGRELPSPSSGEMILIGDETDVRFKEWLRRLPTDAQVRLIAFVPDPTVLPGVYRQTSGRLGVTKVTLPILQNLADDPLLQTSLVRLIIESYSNNSLPISSDP